MFNCWGITPTKKLARDITFWRQNRFPAPILLLARGCDRSPCGDLMPPSLFPPPELQEGSVGPHSYFLQARCVPIEPGYGPARRSPRAISQSDAFRSIRRPIRDKLGSWGYADSERIIYMLILFSQYVINSYTQYTLNKVCIGPLCLYQRSEVNPELPRT